MLQVEYGINYRDLCTGKVETVMRRVLLFDERAKFGKSYMHYLKIAEDYHPAIGERRATWIFSYR